jgi:hypothetical protein
MDLSRLENLKEKLATAKDLSEVGNYFFDHFGENSEFLDLGKPGRNEMLESFIAALGRQLCGGKCVITNMLLVQVPNTHFIHGGCFLNGRLANVIYFDDIEVGLLCLVPAQPGGKTMFSRFSGQALPPEAMASKN